MTTITAPAPAGEIKLRPAVEQVAPAVGMIEPMQPSTAFAAVQRMLEFIANVLLALLDALVARVGRVRDVDGRLQGSPVGRHAPLEGTVPVPDDWSPLDDYDRARIADGVRTLVLAGAAA